LEYNPGRQHEVSEESPGRRLTYLTGVRPRPSTMCSRHSPEGPKVRSHGIEINRHTVEFSSNRRPDQSNQNFRSDRLRPGVVGSCFCFVLLTAFYCLCFSLASLEILSDLRPRFFTRSFASSALDRDFAIPFLRRFPDCIGFLGRRPNRLLQGPDTWSEDRPGLRETPTRHGRRFEQRQPCREGWSFGGHPL
jgi:hypothetical protein